MTTHEHILLALIVLELERANEIAEVASGQPPQLPARERLTTDQLISSIEAYTRG